MQHIIKEFSKSNLSAKYMRELLIYINFIYFAIAILLTTIVLTVFTNVVTVDFIGIVISFTIISLTYLFYKLPKEIKLKDVFILLNIYLLKEKIIFIKEDYFNVNAIITNNLRETIKIILNGKNKALKEAVEFSLFNYFDKRIEDLVYYWDEGYYENNNILNKVNKNSLQSKIEEYKKDKIVDKIDSF
jgi:hypothetical protein